MRSNASLIQTMLSKDCISDFGSTWKVLAQAAHSFRLARAKAIGLNQFLFLRGFRPLAILGHCTYDCIVSKRNKLLF